MKKLFILIAFISFFSCKKNKNDDKKIDATALTSTDANGNILATVDPTDWRFDDQWSPEETALFNFDTNVNTADGQPADTVSTIAYPNPANNAVSAYFRVNKTTFIKYVFVNEKLEIIGKYSHMITKTTPNHPIYTHDENFVSNPGYQ